MFFRPKKQEADKAPAPAAPVKSAAPPKAVNADPLATTKPAPLTAAGKPLSTEQLAERAQVSQRLAVAVGELVGLMLRSQRHRERRIADLRWLAMPAIRLGQYAMVTAQSKSHGYTAPVAAVLWARVSETIDKRLSESLAEPIRLGPREWRSGEILWLVDAIGDDAAIAALVKRLRSKEWMGKAVKARVTDAKGEVKVRTIQADLGPAARSK